MMSMSKANIQTMRQELADADDERFELIVRTYGICCVTGFLMRQMHEDDLMRLLDDLKRELSLTAPS